MYSKINILTSLIWVTAFVSKHQLVILLYGLFTNYFSSLHEKVLVYYLVFSSQSELVLACGWRKKFRNLTFSSKSVKNFVLFDSKTLAFAKEVCSLLYCYM